MVCILSLFRAGHEFKTDSMLKILAHETDLERRLILLLSLRWAGRPAVPVLLKHMDDANFEIATAAACALTDTKPKEAIERFESLLDRHHVSAPLLMYGALAEYKTPEARALFTRLLEDAVEGKKNSQHIYRILHAFADAWDIPQSAYYKRDDRDYKRQALLALNYSRELAMKQKVELRKLMAEIESLKIQLKVAMQIESLRRIEYKRLLALQGDEIVTDAESRQAYTRMKTASEEVKMLRANLAQRESGVASLKNQ